MTQSKQIIDEYVSPELEEWVRENLIELGRMPDWSRLFKHKESGERYTWYRPRSGHYEGEAWLRKDFVDDPIMHHVRDWMRTHLVIVGQDIITRTTEYRHLHSGDTYCRYFVGPPDLPSDSGWIKCTTLYLAMYDNDDLETLIDEPITNARTDWMEEHLARENVELTRFRHKTTGETYTRWEYDWEIRHLGALWLRKDRVDERITPGVESWMGKTLAKVRDDPESHTTEYLHRASRHLYIKYLRDGQPWLRRLFVQR